MGLWWTLARISSLVVVLLATGVTAHAGMCPRDRDAAFIELMVPERTGLVGQTIGVRAGAVHVDFGGFGSGCPITRIPLNSRVELSIHTPSGKARSLAIKKGVASFSPAQPGIYRLTMKALRDGKETLSATEEILIVHRSVGFLLPKFKARQRRVLNFSPWLTKPTLSTSRIGKSPIVAQRRSNGRINLPRIASYWRAPLKRGVLWVATDFDSPRLKVADSLIEFVPSAPLASKQHLLVRVVAKGMPERILSCAGGCSLFVPRGSVSVRVDFGDGNNNEFSLQSQRGDTKHVLSVPHLLAGISTPASPTGLRALPRRVGLGKGQCEDGEPVSLGKRQYRLGSSLCVFESGQWTVAATRPRQYRTGTSRTHPIADGGLLFFAESAVRNEINLVVAGPNGFAVERVVVDKDYRSCHVNEVAVDGDTLAAVGECARGPNESFGFMVIRDRVRTRVMKSKHAVEHVAKAGTGFVASDSDGNIVRCRQRCQRNRLRGVNGIAGFIRTKTSLLVVEHRGSLHPIKGGKLANPEPVWNFRISRVIQTASGSTIALFGPVTSGSAYHPYCVVSVTATLGSKQWIPLHRIGATKGHWMDCQDDDSSPALVIDIATAGGTLYARRRSRSKLTTGFEPLIDGKGVLVAIP